MKIINTCEEIKKSFADGFDISSWRKYAESISKELPEKCETDAKNYNFEKDVFPVIVSALNEAKIDVAENSFNKVTNELTENIRELFEKEPDINIILYLGLCNGAGWATTLDGKNTVLLGVEKIIELNWDDEINMRGLIFHEIGHLWHKLEGRLYFPAYTKRRKSVQQLYQEGVAMVCEQILCKDEKFYNQNVDGWLDWCVENEDEIKKEYLYRINNGISTQDFFGDWCFYKGHSDVGYFLGCRFVRYMMKTYSLKEIANLSYREINREFKRFAEEK